MTPAPRTSIVIVTFNGRRWLDGCIAALRRQAGPFEIVVVDNASADGSAEYLRAQPDVRLVSLAENRGFAGGNNAGAAVAAASDYLVFLNNDTVVQPGWLEALTGTLDARGDAALATSHIVRMDDPAVVDSAGDGYLRAGGAFKRWHGERHPPGASVEEVFGACGAAFAIRRRVFEELGGFDESLFMVYEDVDLSYRARLLGHRCVYVPGAVVHHAGSATLGRQSAQAVYYGQRNLEWVWLKNTPASLLWRGLVAHLLYSAAGLAYYATRGQAGAALRGKWAALRDVRTALGQRSARRRTTAVALGGSMTRGWWRVKRSEKGPVSSRRGHAA